MNTNLLIGASPWSTISESYSNKKKASVMTAPHRKTQKKVGFISNIDEDITKEREIQEGFTQRNNKNQDRMEKVENMINEMNSLHLEDDGHQLANFNPVPRPELQPLDDLEVNLPKLYQNTYDSPDEPSLKNSYLANDPRLFDSLRSGSSYEQSYSNVPYYAKLGNKNRHYEGDSQSLLVDKLNYMIHLLEQQQYEKTDNIMEEFLLYLLLGGFMIYVVDSFTKTGKYIR